MRECYQSHRCRPQRAQTNKHPSMQQWEPGCISHVPRTLEWALHDDVTALEMGEARGNLISLAEIMGSANALLQ